MYHLCSKCHRKSQWEGSYSQQVGILAYLLGTALRYVARLYLEETGILIALASAFLMVKATLLGYTRDAMVAWTGIAVNRGDEPFVYRFWTFTQILCASCSPEKKCKWQSGELLSVLSSPCSL